MQISGTLIVRVVSLSFSKSEALIYKHSKMYIDEKKGEWDRKNTHHFAVSK